MILSCQNICKEFVDNKVLENISFHIEDYEKALKAQLEAEAKA